MEIQVFLVSLSTIFIQSTASTPLYPDDDDDDDDDGYPQPSVPRRARPAAAEIELREQMDSTVHSPLACHANHKSHHPLSHSFARLGRNHGGCAPPPPPHHCLSSDTDATS